MDDVWIILISCSCTWDKLRSQLHRFKAVAWLKTIPCLWICLCVTENIYFITVVYTFVGRSWVRKELAESRSLTACFIKVETSLILLENPDLVWVWKFPVRKLSNPLAFLWRRESSVWPPHRDRSNTQLCEAAQQPLLLFPNAPVYALASHLFWLWRSHSAKPPGGSHA